MVKKVVEYVIVVGNLVNQLILCLMTLLEVRHSDGRDLEDRG